MEKKKTGHQDKINKYSHKWKGSFKVVYVAQPKAYMLEDMQGKKLKNTFNVKHLKNSTIRKRNTIYVKP